MLCFVVYMICFIVNITLFQRPFDSPWSNVSTALNCNMFNPYKPSVLFVGHRQCKIRSQNVASDQVLHCTVCSQKLILIF